MRASGVAEMISEYLEDVDIFVGERGFYGTEIYFYHRVTKREFNTDIFNLTEYLRWWQTS